MLCSTGCHRLALPAFIRLGKHEVHCTRASSTRMGGRSMGRNQVTTRVERVAGYMTEIIEHRSEAPSLQIVFIPGNPGIIAFYQTYFKALYEQFDGKATITAISHIAHTAKDWHNGQVFSFEEQINHKVQFLESNYANNNVPLLLVGHSIGTYIALCALKRLPDKVEHVIGLYPFIAINTNSTFQSLLRWFSGKQACRELLSRFAGFVGGLPNSLSRGMVSGLIGHGWSEEAVDVASEYLLQYSVVRNFCYMGMTEFQKLEKHPDWGFLKQNQDRISLLFGVDDHWGPLTLFEEISRQVPDLDVEIEKEGHEHTFCCTEVGSYWVAVYCSKLIMQNVRNK